MCVFVQEDGSLKAFGRDHRPHLEFFARFPRLETMLGSLRRLPPFTSIDGEVYCPGMPASCVSTALRDASEDLVFQPFAVPTFAGKDRRSWSSASGVGNVLMDFDLPFTLPDVLIIDGDVDRTTLLRIAKSKGIEGWILKEAQYLGWYKVKEANTVDAVITGMTPGRGKFANQVGSIEVSLEGKVIADVGGMDDHVRMLMTEDPCLIGKVVEVEYQYVGSGGRLRHPRFVRFRDDKPASQCLRSQLDDH